MDSLMVIPALSQASVQATTIQQTLFCSYFLMQQKYMVFHLGCVEIMVLKIFMLLPGWNHAVEFTEAPIYGEGDSIQLISNFIFTHF